MFVLPVYIGRGYGERLMTHVLDKIAKERCTRIILYAEPKAEDFYKRFGFVKIGELPEAIENRF